MGTGSFPGVKCGRGVLLTAHPLSSAVVMEEYSYTSTHHLGHNAPVTGSLFLYLLCPCNCGPGNSVGIATELRAGRSGIESPWRRDLPPFQTDPGAHPASCRMGTGSFPGVKCGRGVLLTTHPLLVPWSWKSRAIPLPTIWATPGL